MLKDTQRLFFLVKDEPVVEDIETSLVEFGVNEDRIFIYDSLSEDMVALPEQNLWERDRKIPIQVWGVILGAAAGLLSAYLRSLSGDVISQDMIVLVAFASAILGGVMFHIAAGNVHEKRLQQFQNSVYQNGLLIVTDVPQQNYRKIHQQIIARHAAKYLGAISHVNL